MYRDRIALTSASSVPQRTIKFTDKLEGSPATFITFRSSGDITLEYTLAGGTDWYSWPYGTVGAGQQFRVVQPTGMEVELIRFGEVSSDTTVEVFASTQAPHMEQTTDAGAVEGTTVTLFLPVGFIYKGSSPTGLSAAGLTAPLADAYGGTIRYVDRLQRVRSADIGALTSADEATDYITVDADMSRGVIRKIGVEAQSVLQVAPTLRISVYGDDVAVGGGSDVMRFIDSVDILLHAVVVNGTTQATETATGEYMWEAAVEAAMHFANLEATETTNLYFTARLVGANLVAEGYVTFYIEPRATWAGGSY